LLKQTCAGIAGICMLNPSIAAPKVSEISAFIRADGQTDRRTWLYRLG